MRSKVKIWSKEKDYFLDPVSTLKQCRIVPKQT